MIEVVTLFKNDNHERFLRAFNEAVRVERGEAIDWKRISEAYRERRIKQKGFFATSPTVDSIMLPEPYAAGIVSKIAKDLNVPRVDVFFQQHKLWEFALSVDGLTRIKFSVAPEAWEEPNPRWQEFYVDTPRDLAEIWEVPVERIEKYMVHWQTIEVWEPTLEMMVDSYALKGEKAYSTDQYGYGQQEQGFDFIRALGGELPWKGKEFWLPAFRT
jgi:hypothetical protein